MSKDRDIFRQQWLVTQIDPLWAARERRSYKPDSGSSSGQLGGNTSHWPDLLTLYPGLEA